MTGRVIGSSLFVVLAGLVLPATASAQVAQEEAPPPVPATEDAPPAHEASTALEALTREPALEAESRGELAARLEAARGLRLAGILSTSLGLGVLAVGSALAMAGAVGFGLSLITLTWGDLDAWAAMYVGGFILAIAGAVATLAGIPMWAVGGVRARRLARALAHATPVLALASPSGGGYAGLVFRL